MWPRNKDSGCGLRTRIVGCGLGTRLVGPWPGNEARWQHVIIAEQRTVELLTELSLSGVASVFKCHLQ